MVAEDRIYDRWFFAENVVIQSTTVAVVNYQMVGEAAEFFGLGARKESQFCRQ